MNKKSPCKVTLVIVTLGMLIAVSEVQIAKANNVQIGVKAGDWIRYDYTFNPPISLPLPSVQWRKIEFLNVEDPLATLRLTTHMSSGIEGNGTLTWNVTKGNLFLDSICFIQANCQMGQVVDMRYANATIAGETTRAYLGVSRTVVHTSYLQSNNNVQYTYYWDKETGVMVEAISVGPGSEGVEQTATIKVTDTNIWQALFLGLPIDPTIFYALAIAAIVIVAGAALLVIRRKKKPPKEVALLNS